MFKLVFTFGKGIRRKNLNLILNKIKIYYTHTKNKLTILYNSSFSINSTYAVSQIQRNFCSEHSSVNWLHSLKWKYRFHIMIMLRENRKGNSNYYRQGTLEFDPGWKPLPTPVLQKTAIPWYSRYLIQSCYCRLTLGDGTTKRKVYSHLPAPNVPDTLRGWHDKINCL